MKDRVPAGHERRRRLGGRHGRQVDPRTRSSSRCSPSTTRCPARTPATSTPGSPRSTPRGSTRSSPSRTRSWPCSAGRTRRSVSVCFRIYNEHIADVQERSGGRIFGVGLINWWDADGTRRTLDELKALGLKTFLMPLNPGKDDDKVPIDYASTAMDGVWAAIEEAGLPVSHHIGESPPATPNEFNAVEHRHAPVGRAVPRHVRQVRLRRDPRPPPRPADRVVRGRDQLGAVGAPGRRAHRRVVPPHQQPRSASTTRSTTGTTT